MILHIYPHSLALSIWLYVCMYCMYLYMYVSNVMYNNLHQSKIIVYYLLFSIKIIKWGRRGGFLLLFLRNEYGTYGYSTYSTYIVT